MYLSAGQRTRRNSTLEDWPRVKYLHGYIGSLLDALRYVCRPYINLTHDDVKVLS